MSEKRFTLDDESRIWDNKSVMTALDIVFMLNEQQATIRKLQDLCGESDYENAKLRLKNKKLKEENEQLRKKNKQIGFLKRDLFILLNLIKDTPMEHNYDYIKIRERWE